MKLKKLAHLIALIGVAGPAMAQSSADVPEGKIQRVEITGSSIKRVAKEGALPVQVIKFADLQKQGVTSAEDVMNLIASNGTGVNNPTSNNNVFGADADRLAGGGSFADLRGLGANATLVLLNGRRVSTYGKSGNAVDLNSIPTSAIERIEILKDGASAIYGTDAIGGVINFILKTNYEGVEVSTTNNVTQAGGGNTYRASVIAGKGNLESDGFNVMGTFSATKNMELASHQRDFANGFQPSRGLSPDTTGTPAANQLTGTGVALGSSFTMPNDSTKYLQAGLLSLQGKCDTVPNMGQYVSELWKDVTPVSRSKYSCAYDYGADYVMQSPSKQLNGLGRVSFKLSPDTKLFVEAMASHSEFTSILTPLQISATTATSNGSGSTRDITYPVGGPYYQDLSAYIPTFDKTKPIAYKWRADPLGNRTQANKTDGARVLVGLEGTVHDYDYKLGLSHAENETKTTLLDGYAYADPLFNVLHSGVVDVFSGGPQSQAAMDALNATKYAGKFSHGKTTLTQADGNISGQVYELPAGPLAVAAGFDLRREGYMFNQDVDATQIYLAPGNGNFPSIHRDIVAFYAESIVPVTKALEVQLAVRRDHYSVIGATTNPKVAFRYQPTNWLLFRGSANKGFLAPSFNQLYSAQLYQLDSNGRIDTVGCAAHPGNDAFCAPEKLNYYSGGNPDLRPTTTKQGTLGFVIEPTKNFSASLDYWAVNMKDLILNRNLATVMANQALLAGNIHRNPADGTIDYVTTGWINAAGAKTHGADINLHGNGEYAGYKWVANLDATWTQNYKYAEIDGQPMKDLVGEFSTTGLYLRWKQNATFTVSRGDWSAQVNARYASGYADQVPDDGHFAPPGFNPRVASYTIWGLSTTYTGIKSATLTFGILNLFDRDPPFTAHNVDYAVGAGWDPRVADPRGRTFTLAANYKF